MSAEQMSPEQLSAEQLSAEQLSAEQMSAEQMSADRRSKCLGAFVSEHLSHFSEQLSAEHMSPEHMSCHKLSNMPPGPATGGIRSVLVSGGATGGGRGELPPYDFFFLSARSIMAMIIPYPIMILFV